MFLSILFYIIELSTCYCITTTTAANFTNVKDTAISTTLQYVYPFDLLIKRKPGPKSESILIGKNEDLIDTMFKRYFHDGPPLQKSGKAVVQNEIITQLFVNHNHSLHRQKRQEPEKKERFRSFQVVKV